MPLTKERQHPYDVIIEKEKGEKKLGLLMLDRYTNKVGQKVAKTTDIF